MADTLEQVERRAAKYKSAAHLLNMERDEVVEALQAKEAELAEWKRVAEALAGWMGRHDDFCPLDDDGDAALAAYVRFTT